MAGEPDLGWDEAWEAARRAADPEGALEPVRIATEHRGAYHAVGRGGVAWVELTGRAFHRAADKRQLPTVGDWVVVERWTQALASNGAAVIHEILPRRSLLVRKAAGEATAPQPLAANVDIGIVMTSANRDLSPARLDRYITLLRDGGIAPALILSKIDLVTDPEPMLEALRQVAPGAPAIGVSSVAGTNLDAVRALAGTNRTAVLLGSSGVGKSSLLNALLGSETQLIQAIRADERGRHTTTRRELFVTGHGLWIDTPGMRELAQFIDDGEEDVAFEDIATLAASCKFRDCQHRAEPGCAVRAAVESGAISAERVASYQKLSSERATGITRQQEAQRIAESRRAKAKKPTRPGED
ncbi:MAG: rsgA [Myxococcales bacterium]|nr:rsgA [Myxococcales bacterium]